METNQENKLITSWLSLTDIHMTISNELEGTLQENHHLSLREFYVLLFLSQTPDKKLRLQQLQKRVGLSQSAMSRLVKRLEAKSCGVLQRHLCLDDRRGIYTSLTREGEEKLEKALVTFNKTLATSFSKTEFQYELQTLMQHLKI
jgi:DNA-binding MarR family transcriptional regulator